MEMLEQVEAAKLDDAQLFKLFGRKEAVAAYENLLLNRERFGKARGAVQEAQRSDQLAGHLALKDPTADLARLERTTKAAEEMTAEPLAPQPLLWEASQRQMAIEARAGRIGTGLLPAEEFIAGRRFVDKYVGWIPGYKATVMASRIRAGYYKNTPELEARMVNYLGGVEQVFSDDPIGQQRFEERQSRPVPVVDLRNRGDINEGNFFRKLEGATPGQESAVGKTDVPVPTLDIRGQGEINSSNFFRVVQSAATQQEKSSKNLAAAAGDLKAATVVTKKTTLAHPDVDR